MHACAQTKYFLARIVWTIRIWRTYGFAIGQAVLYGEPVKKEECLMEAYNLFAMEVLVQVVERVVS